jgi:protein involved in polysaccharide export with SLBB domain
LLLLLLFLFLFAPLLYSASHLIRLPYVLGAGDQLSLVVENLSDDFADKIFRIDLGGGINLPLAGRLHAAGLTIPEFELEIQQQLARFVKDPSGPS